MEKKELRSEYDRRLNALGQLAETVSFLIHKQVTRRKIKIHSLLYRVKSFDSFFEKMRRKRIANPFSEITDLVGLRVVCLFMQDVKLIGDIVGSSFEILGENNKIEVDDVDVFGYMSLHFVTRLKQKPSDLSSLQVVNAPLPNYFEWPFEIQIRTIAQDAWASISHYLDYKQESQIPSELKRDFHALSGLFYVADTHFAILQKQAAKRAIDEAAEK
jgi:putative GTP pyrophosphokinase